MLQIRQFAVRKISFVFCAGLRESNKTVTLWKVRTEGLSESGIDNVNFTVDSAVLGRSAAGLAQKARGVALINHQQCAVLVHNLIGK
jgi:hypothetical protein